MARDCSDSTVLRRCGEAHHALHRLREHDGDGVVEHRLAEDEHVEQRLDVQRLEDGQRRHRVDGRDESAERERVQPAELVHQVGLEQKSRFT